MSKSFIHARILEVPGHQLLVRCCDHTDQLPPYAAAKLPAGPAAVLVIDTYTVHEGQVRALQLPIDMGTPALLLAGLEIFGTKYSHWALRIMLVTCKRTWTDEEVRQQTQALSNSLLEAARIHLS
jgi:hypothetical protein